LTPPQRNITYIVRPGDSLYNIARRYNTTVAALYAANPGVSPNSLQIGQTILIPRTVATPPADALYTRAQVNLMNLLRELWEEHIVWTKLAIMGIVNNSPDTDLVINRLLRNPSDFAAQLRPLYGQRAAQEFETLLRNHLIIASQLVEAAKAGDTQAVTDIEEEWYDNADDIAEFLSRINANWSEDTWETMLHKHLELVKAEAVNQIEGNYEANIALFDEMEKQALEMADYMSEGIMRQFPSRYDGLF